MMPTSKPTRRHFVSCASHLTFAATVLPAPFLERWARATAGAVVAEEPFGRLEQIGDGIWALISTPLSGDRTTLSNGGLIAGRGGVVAIEGFNTPAGATWLATQARTLTGRWPTHVVISHYHADHANGVLGYLQAERPAVRVTEATREQVITRNTPADEARATALREATVLSPKEPAQIDLGSRTVRVIPRAGHTSSDVTVEVDDPSVVFCGDLVWNAMFPNYVDASPVDLSAAVKALRRSSPATTYVPGHGAVAKDADLTRYVSMLDAVEAAARAAKQKGATAADAAASFSLPASLGEWTLFNKAFYERAMSAWYKVI